MVHRLALSAHSALCALIFTATVAAPAPPPPSTTPSVGLTGDVPCPTALTPGPVPVELRDEDLVPAPRALRLGAFDIAIVPGPALAAHPAAMGAFERAARQWEAYISDPVTVRIEAEIAPIGDAHVIGRTASVALSGDYDPEDSLVPEGQRAGRRAGQTGGGAKGNSPV